GARGGGVGAPGAVDCVRVGTRALGTGPMLLGKIVGFRVDRRVMKGGRVNVCALDRVARLGAPLSTPLGDVFQLARPHWEQLSKGAAAPAVCPAAAAAPCS